MCLVGLGLGFELVRVREVQANITDVSENPLDKCGNFF